MGQQQLLLLVLSTVIVGLATVAGIQAFSENQQQAAQDALTQRALNIASDINSAANKPTQMGGVKLGDGNTAHSTSTVASRIGLSSDTGIPADGAGDGAVCKISSVSGGTAKVKCDDNGTYGSGNSSDNITITAKVDPDANEPVKITNTVVGS